MPRILILLSLLTSLFVIFPQPIQAQQGWFYINRGCLGPTEIDALDVATIEGIECLVFNIFQVAISLIGIAIVVMILLGGFQLLTSGGDPKAVEAGKNTITYAILGLVLAISSWIIINLIARITGNSNITNFDIPTSQTQNSSVGSSDCTSTPCSCGGNPCNQYCIYPPDGTPADGACSPVTP